MSPIQKRDPSEKRPVDRHLLEKLHHDLKETTIPGDYEPTGDDASLDHFARWLTGSPIVQPDETHLNDTLHKLKLEMHLHPELQPQPTRWQRVQRVLLHVLHESDSIHPMYWLGCLLLYTCTLLLILLSAQHTIALDLLLPLTAPLPFMIGMHEVFRSRQIGMLELENSCLYNAPAIATARLLLVSTYSVLLNSLPILVIGLVGEPLPLLQAVMLCLVPLAICSGLALYVSMRFRGASGLYTLLVLWIAVGILVLSFPALGQTLMSLHHAIYPFILVGGLSFFIIQLRALQQRMAATDT